MIVQRQKKRLSYPVAKLNKTCLRRANFEGYDSRVAYMFQSIKKARISPSNNRCPPGMANIHDLVGTAKLQKKFDMCKKKCKNDGNF